MADGFYSATAARRSLLYFGTGKLGAGATGLALLLLTLRTVPKDVFGIYVALMAVVEIFYLVSGLGLTFQVQRYLPQLRIQATAIHFTRQVWRLLNMRLWFSVAFAVPLFLLSEFWTAVLDLPLPAGAIGLFSAGLITGCLMRFSDEIFQSLLLQGWAQAQALGRNALRAGILAIAWIFGAGVSINFMLVLELAVSGLASAVALWMFRVYLKRTSGTVDVNANDVVGRGAWGQSLRFYAAQILAQTYSPNATKLVVTGLVGVQGTAVYGFAQSIGDLLRNYSPAFLLGGWIRPLMVSHFLEHREASRLRPLTSLVITISVVGLLPVIFVFAVFGPQLANLFGGARYPQAAPLLAPLALVVCLQAVHTVYGMLCTTIERAQYVLLATAICSLTLPLTFACTKEFGLAGTTVALILSEALWIAAVVTQLSREFEDCRFTNSAGLARALATAVLIGLLLTLLDRSGALPGPSWIAAACVAAIAYWLLAWFTGVFSADERSLVARVLPGRARSTNQGESR